MAKLVVNVLDACDLLPTDGHGSASPFVEVDFDGRRQRTQTKSRHLYPSWNEKLAFDIKNPRNLQNSVILVTLYDDHYNDFLGCVQISGASVSLLESEATVQRYPLCKRGFFSHGRGVISLKIYAVRAQYYGNQPQPRRLNSEKTPKLQEIREWMERESEIWRFNPKVESGSNSVDGEMADVEERTRLPVDRLFVKVVKADLLVNASLCPYVEVKFNQYKGVTKQIVKNEPPVWDKVFAFYNKGSGDQLVEVVVKDFDTEEFIGSMVVLDTVPVRLQDDSPLTLQWYILQNQERDDVRGRIMLGVWMGTKADDAFPRAWNSDYHDIIPRHNLPSTGSSVHFTPTLYYLRVQVLKAQDLAPIYMDQPPQFGVRVCIGNQVRPTSISRQLYDGSFVWNEEVMLVAFEPLDTFLFINVLQYTTNRLWDLIWKAALPLGGIPQRFDSREPAQAQWINLNGHSSKQQKGSHNQKQGKILLKLYLEAGYHVSQGQHGDFQPSANHLKKDVIGSLQLAILGAQNLPSMKQRDGGTATDAYCVAKYGNKWIRTRTIINSQDPCWNEQYVWEVYDPCTVICIGIFDNGNVNGSKKDMKIGKVFIHLQTLEVNRIQTHYLPIFVLGPYGLKNHGKLQVAVKFTSFAWATLFAQYTKPLLPSMHYLQPITARNLHWCQTQVVQIVMVCFSKAELPIKKEIVEHMFDDNYILWSLRKQKAQFERVMLFVLGTMVVYRLFDEICHWRNPLKTIFFHVAYLVLVWYPKMILPTFFLLLSIIGLWNYIFRPRNPSHVDDHLSWAKAIDQDDLDEEFDTFPTCRRPEIVKKRYDRLKSVAGRYQTVLGDIATLGERAKAILTCEDRRATSIFTAFAFFWVVFIYMASFRFVATLLGLYWLRHPWFRSKMPSPLVNLFMRLPSKTDVLLWI